MSLIQPQIEEIRAATVRLLNTTTSPLHRRLITEEANKLLDSLNSLIIITPQQYN